MSCERATKSLSAIFAPVAESRVQTVPAPAGLTQGENAILRD
jgi:hypothetical protein